jgi:hypothetical protein
MLLRDEDQRHLAIIHRGPGRLYKLDMKIAWHVCHCVYMGECMALARSIWELHLSEEDGICRACAWIASPGPC